MATWTTKLTSDIVATSHINDLQTLKLDIDSDFILNTPLTGIAVRTDVVDISGVMNNPHSGVYISADFQTITNADRCSALQVYAKISGTSWSNVTEGILVTAEVASTNLTGIQSLYGIRVSTVNSGAGALAHMMAFKANPPFNSGGGTISKCWGFYIADQTLAGVESSAIHIAGAGIENAITFSGNNSDGKNAYLYSSGVGHFDFNVAYTGFTGEVTVDGALNAAGPYLLVAGQISHESWIETLDKVGTGWVTWATRNLAGAEVRMSLLNVDFSDDVEFSQDITVRGVLNASGSALMVAGGLDHKSNIEVLDKAGTGWVIWVTRNVTGAEAIVNLWNLGTINPITRTAPTSTPVDGFAMYSADPAGATGTEVVTDGGMETWASATDLTNWTEIVAGTSTVNRETTEKHAGAYACRLDIDAGNSNAAIYQEVALTASGLYKLSVWYKTAASKPLRFQLYDTTGTVFVTSTGAWAGNTWITPPASATWTEHVLYFAGHPSYTNYYLMIGRDAVDSSSSSIYIDSVSIKNKGGAGPEFRTEAGNVIKLFKVIDPRADDAINTVAWDATTAGVLAAMRDAMLALGVLHES
jgi:hypothetical protein